MVANLSSYRPPIESSRFGKTFFSRVESLRRFIQRHTTAEFLIRGYDQSFCRAVTDEAMLAIHADIDEYDESDFREWAVKIAVRIGFEKIRKLQVIKTRLLKTELSKNSEAGNATAHQPKYSELDLAFLGDMVEKKIQETQELLRLHREMVRGILDGKRPIYVADELNLNASFLQIFMGEAVRKLNLLQRYSRTEFEVLTNLR